MSNNVLFDFIFAFSAYVLMMPTLIKFNTVTTTLLSGETLSFIKLNIDKFTCVDADVMVPDGWSLVLLNKHAVLRGRISSGTNGKYIQFHRYILGLDKSDKRMVDHINKDPLDNRRCNLRICTNQENAFNNHGKGCSFNKKTGKWVVKVTQNYKSIYLGAFRLEKDAIKCANEWKLANRGEFASTYHV
jgi:hypothetical protein